MPPMTRQHLLEQACYPIDARHGTPYPCRQRDLDIVRQHASRNEGPFVSQRQATLEIVNHNDPRRRLPSYEREAICRLSDALRDSARYTWGPDLVIKAFLDLDLVFFGGILRGYVCVLWDSMENFADRGTSQGRTAVSPRPGNARIYLNAQAILLCPTPFRHMFSTVLHEMCHAFEIVRVHPDDLSPTGNGHDVEFGTRVHAVDRKAKALLQLEAIADGESWPHYSIMGRA